jgi:precorrin-8X/cobalt-precorrin-8 methylmutase
LLDQGPRRPEDIERASMALIEAEAGTPLPFAGHEWSVVRRLIHTSADFEMLALTRFHPRAVESGLSALALGATIVTDTHMARVGMPDRRMGPLGCRVICHMTDPWVADRARQDGTTRARAAMDLAAGLPGPLIFAIGNAPTALLRLIQLLDQGAAAPALVVGMPVGFVNAAESKDLLMAQDRVPWISIAGRKGGSALAAATLNALADILLAQGGQPGPQVCPS